MGRKKSAFSNAALKMWLKEIGNEIRRRRLPEKQDAFAERVGISTRTLSSIETGARAVGSDALLRALAGLDENPVQGLLRKKFPTQNPRHMELHTRLQELLDAGGAWEITAETNTDSVWERYQKKKTKE